MLLATGNVRNKVRWSASVFFFLSGLITSTWAARIPAIQQKFGLNDVQWGSVLSALPLGLVCGLPISTWLVTRFGTARMMTIAALLNASLLVCISIETNVATLVVTLFFFGFARNLSTLSNNTNTIEVQALFTKPIIATFHGVWSVACFIGAGIGTFMIARNIKPSLHFLIIAAFAVVLILLSKRKIRKRSMAVQPRRRFFMKPDKYLFLLGIITLCSMMCEGAVFDWSVNYFEKVVHAEKSKITFGYVAFISMMAIGRLASTKIQLLFEQHTLLIINGLVMATGFLIAVVFPYLWPASIGFLLIGIGDAIVIPMIYMLASKSKIMPPAYAIASVTLIGYIGFLTGPPIIGSISNAFGMRWAFALVGFLSLCISLLTFYMKKNNIGERSC